MRKIFIFGGGQFGKFMFPKFLEEGYNIVSFIDNYSDIREIQGVSVLPLSESKDMINEEYEIYICIKSYYYIGDVIRELYNNDITNAYIVDPSVMGTELKISELKERRQIYYLDFKEKAVISKLEYHVIDRCNLNCVGCSHFAPIFHDKPVACLDFKKQIRIVSNKFANVLRFRLMGGEPFLNPEIGDFAIEARKYLPYTHLEIVTNGLLYENVSEENWRKIKEADAVLNISLYPPTYKIMDKIAKKLCTEDIEYSFGSGLEQYNDQGIIEEFHKCFTANKGHDIQKAASHCVGKYCHYLRDSKISKCALPLLIGEVNSFYKKNYIVTEGDIFDLEKTEDPWAIVNRLSKPTPFCGYCTEGVLERFRWQVSKEHKFEDYIVEENHGY